MNITIIGAGAIGLLFAAKLAPCCESLELVTRSEEQAALLRSRWIDLDGAVCIPASTITIHSYEQLALEDYNKQNPEPDYLLLAVKQAALDERLIKYAAERIGSEGKLVCLQNGLGHTDKLLQYIAPERLFLAVTTEGAKKTETVAVTHTGRGMTYIGSPERFADVRNSDIKDFCEVLNKAGFRAETSNRIMSKVWNKLVINAVINPVTALMRVPNGKLLSSVAAMALMEDIYKEASAVAQSRGVELSADLWDQTIDVCRLTSNNLSSMLQDVLAGRRTEIDWITGALLDIGETEGLKLPVNQTVYRLVKAMESK